MKENQVNHPSHYNHTHLEVIVMMEHLWGTKKVVDYCRMNAFKYRMRAGVKESIPGDSKGSIVQDIKKARWYEKYALKLQNKVRNGEEIKEPIE